MKQLLFFIALTLMSSMSHANVKLSSLKIDYNWKIKYDPAEWSYLYLKPATAVTSNIFENKKEKIKLILQKETHLNGISDVKKLTAQKCSEANTYYSQKQSGKAALLSVNNTIFCYIQYTNASGEKAHQLLTPETTQTKNYDVFSYAWASSDEKSKDVVVNFLKRFVK